MKATRPSPLERIKARIVEVPAPNGGPPCWVYTGHNTPAGYGQNKVAGRKVLVHRFMWEQMVGPIADGYHIDHLCRNRACCNPAHLEPVTPQINQHRGMGFSGINARKTHCHRGHDLNEANVYMTPKGSRMCKPCRRIAQATYKAKRRSQ